MTETPPPDVPPAPDADPIEAAENATEDLPLGGSGHEGITDGDHINDVVEADKNATADLPIGSTGTGETNPPEAPPAP